MNRILSLALALAAFVVSPLVVSAEVVRLRVDDTIQPASQRFIERGLEEAAERGAELVVIELDTPGGLVDTTRRITTAITSSRVPVVVFVTPAGARAASAGFFILLSADVAAMSPGTNTGAATPVMLPMIPGQGDAQPSDEMKIKITNDVSAMIRSISDQRGRNTELAMKAVTEALSFTADEALKDGLIEIVSPDLDDLVGQLAGRAVTRFNGDSVVLTLSDRRVVDLEPTRVERFQSLLANPMVAFILLALAGLGIYTEITHPGGIVPGVVGVAALLLFLFSASILPVNWFGIILLVTAVVLFALEVKFTSFGLLTIGGLICFIVGALMLFDTPIPEMRLSLGEILPTAVLVGALVIVILTKVLGAHRRRPMTGSEGLVGEVGKVLSALAPTGKVAVHGEYWDARTASAEVAAGAEVRVVAIEGRRLLVAPVDARSETEGS